MEIQYNKYYVGDNSQYLKQLDNDSINLIYFDPPYNTGRNFFDFDDRFKTIDDYILFFENNPGAIPVNVTFGELNKEEWIVFHKKHFTHHLSQFGLM